MHKTKIITWMLLLLCNNLVFAKNNHQFHSEPQWVNSKKLNTNQIIPVERVNDGRHYLLVDNQIQVSKTGTVETYNHYAEYIVNQNGIKNSSQLSLDFDPAYQKLFMHNLWVWRKGKKIEKSQTARITLIQPERESKDLIYNGVQSLNIILDDIRVGDTIEYSYSVQGSNPVFGGIFDTVRHLQWGVPVGEIYQRILWQKPTPLYYKKTNTNVEIEQVRRNSATEYIIETKDVPAINLNDATPDWFSPYASVSFSESKNWEDVVKWGSKLFSRSNKSSANIRILADKIKKDHGGKQQQIAAALQYIQANVRYLGLELGENSHLPTSPDVTLQRRYGDCKDKSALYITLLRELGITAYPVLVNTNKQHEINKSLPAFGAFNHAIVKVMHDDKYYWFDPTRQYQLGTVLDIYQPDYGYALVLKSGSNDLESMLQTNKAYSVIANDQFYVDIKQRDKVRYEINTSYSGLNAEIQRNRIASKGIQNIQKDYLNFYKNIYPGIKAVDVVELKENPGNGGLIANEKYTISDFWREDKKNNKFIGNFYTSNISSYLKRPKRKSREHPFSLSYPVRVEQNITVSFAHDDWAFPKKSFTEDNEFFQYKSDVFYDKTKRQLHLNYAYKSKTDSISVKHYKEYITALKRAYDDSDYSIEYQTAAATSGNTGQAEKNWFVNNVWIIGLMLYGFLIILGIVLWISADKKNTTDVATKYYPVSVPKFLFMWIMTLGLYGVYWFYKNYNFIKSRDGSSIMPVARGVFNIFWYYPLYKDLTLHKINNSVKATILPLYMGIIFAILFFVTSIVFNLAEQFILISLLISALLIIPMVNYIYHINEIESVSSRYNSRFTFRHMLMTFLFLPLLLVIIGTDTGLVANDSVVTGNKLYGYDLKYMQRKGIINPGDKVIYFYSDAFIFIRNDGNGFTPRHVFSYWIDNNELQVETANFDEIKDIKITWGESFTDDTVIKIVRKDGTDFLLYVSNTDNKDKVFGQDLKRRWQQVIKKLNKFGQGESLPV